MTSLDLHLADEAATRAFAETLSLWARPGLVIALTGDLGAGKSTFARALITALFKPDLHAGAELYGNTCSGFSC
jgi:N-acetylmuramate 1-kinase